MFKLLVTLLFSITVLANCNYEISFDFDQNISLGTKKSTITKSKYLLRQMNYFDAPSEKSVKLKFRLDNDLNRFKMKVVTLVRIDGVLRNYAYGESRKYRKYRSALELASISNALVNSIKQLPSCSDD